MTGMRLFDSHCHINSKEFDEDREEVIARMKESGLTGAVVIGCEDPELKPLRALLSQHPGYLWGAWALHPEYQDVDHEPTVEEICSANADPNFVAVGETGLDYYWHNPPARGRLSGSSVISRPRSASGSLSSFMPGTRSQKQSTF